MCFKRIRYVYKTYVISQTMAEDKQQQCWLTSARLLGPVVAGGGGAGVSPSATPSWVTWSSRPPMRSDNDSVALKKHGRNQCYITYSEWSLKPLFGIFWAIIVMCCWLPPTKWPHYYRPLCTNTNAGLIFPIHIISFI